MEIYGGQISTSASKDLPSQVFTISSASDFASAGPAFIFQFPAIRKVLIRFVYVYWVVVIRCNPCTTSSYSLPTYLLMILPLSSIKNRVGTWLIFSLSISSSPLKEFG